MLKVINEPIVSLEEATHRPLAPIRLVRGETRRGRSDAKKPLAQKPALKNTGRSGVIGDRNIYPSERVRWALLGKALGIWVLQGKNLVKWVLQEKYLVDWVLQERDTVEWALQDRDLVE